MLAHAEGRYRYAVWATVLLLAWPVADAADKASEKLAELSDEFLEYLGSLENEDDNWTDFTTHVATDAKSTAKAASSTSISISQSSASQSSASTRSSMSAAVASKADK